MASIRKIEHLLGRDLAVAALANAQIDAEMGKKDHLGMETKPIV
ncbi:hypothetical protein TRIP_B200666 [uncultured Desulfatiglans sp.]|uniref:Uncharacterized protein n=1 Tax=Uncultured Desulfatiglans sp. TaxID=1748965 RepID=A0A653A3A7_UNCDX|nr:hypothetical protein TRIP_B200666 [uncultured Desulfatiglans sp.]